MVPHPERADQDRVREPEVPRLPDDRHSERWAVQGIHGRGRCGLLIRTAWRRGWGTARRLAVAPPSKVGSSQERLTMYKRVSGSPNEFEHPKDDPDLDRMWAARPGDVGFRDMSRDEIEAMLVRNRVGRLAFALYDRVDIQPIH